MTEEHPGEPWLALDTTLEAARVQTGIYQGMTMEQRWRQALQMADSAKRMSMAGVRARHPDYSPRQVELAVIRMMLGDNLFRRAYPGEEANP